MDMDATGLPQPAARGARDSFRAGLTEQDHFEQPGFADLATFRQGAYRLLAAWLLYPDEDALAVAREASAFMRQYDEMASTLAWWPSWDRLLTALADLPAEAVADLAADYMRLFGGSGTQRAIPLWESAYLRSSEAGSLTTADIAGEYRHHGLDLAAREAPDHLAVELEYLSFLCGAEVEAWLQPDGEPVAALESEHQFLEQHLQHWAPTVAARIAERGSELYSAISRAAADLVVTDVALTGTLQRAARER